MAHFEHGLPQSFVATKCVNNIPRPAGVWLVTRPAGGGGQRAPGPVRELPVQGQKFDPEVTDDVTGQVKVRIFDFSGLATSASKMYMLSANKANESAWIVSLDICKYHFVVLCGHKTGQGHLRSPGEKGQTKTFRDLELRYMF